MYTISWRAQPPCCPLLPVLLIAHAPQQRHPAQTTLPPLSSPLQARTAAYAVEEARRAERLAEMYGGGNVVTLASTSSMDEDGMEQALQRLNIILKVIMGAEQGWRVMVKA